MAKKRSTPQVVTKRRTEVAELLAAQVSGTEIAERIAERYSISTRMAWKDIKTVYDTWETDSSRERGFRRHRMRNTMMAFYQRCMARRQYTAALGALDRLCKLDGLYAPEKLEVEHTGSVDISKLTSAQIRDRIDELLDIRRTLLDGTEAPSFDGSNGKGNGVTH